MTPNSCPWDAHSFLWERATETNQNVVSEHKIPLSATYRSHTEGGVIDYRGGRRDRYGFLEEAIADLKLET